MDDSYKKKQLSAYERRKINSQKIAQVQFEPKHYSAPEFSDYSPKNEHAKYKPYNQEREKFTPKTTKKEVWTPVDQKKEEELWDE